MFSYMKTDMGMDYFLTHYVKPREAIHPLHVSVVSYISPLLAWEFVIYCRSLLVQPQLERDHPSTITSI